MYRESEGVMEKNSLIQKIQSIGIEKLIGEKQIVFSQGDKAEAFGYIVEGEVRAYRMDDQGREKEVGRFLSGTYFGEVILFASETYPVFAETVTPSRILFFSERTASFASSAGCSHSGRLFEIAGPEMSCPQLPDGSIHLENG